MLTIDERNKLILDNIDLVQKNVNRLLRKINIPIDEGELTGQLNVAFVLAANKI